MTVETSAFPTVNVDVGDAVLGEQGLMTKFLKPRISVYRDGQRIFVKEPAGPLESAPPYKLIGLLVLLVGTWTILRLRS